MSDLARGKLIEEAIREASGPALCAYLMAGYPTMDEFARTLVDMSSAADVVEIGIPFSDPMADGQTIQHASHEALERGATLGDILDVVESVGDGLEAPVLLMGYYNPFFIYGLEELSRRVERIGVAGLIVPDLPLEESDRLESLLAGEGLALIRLVTPATPGERVRLIGSTAQGFVYAVTTTGITGGDVEVPPEMVAYLDRIRAATSRPVLAGFGVRRPDQVEALAPHVDGVVVGSALIDAIDRGASPVELLASLRPTSPADS